MSYWATAVCIVFYVNGASVGGSDPVHTSPWATSDQAYAAADQYLEATNARYAQLHPNSPYTYFDPDPAASIIADVAHPGPDGTLRYCMLPDWDDMMLPPPAGTDLIEYEVGDEGVFVPPP